ncbi:hypothetical protein [Pseudomonas sp. NPDC088890]|uniref:hypothetical protein n=1 Tax=Pseudomonas sp. NPDC088890 TaxID=3364458 RepID=UPI0038501B06
MGSKAIDALESQPPQSIRDEFEAILLAPDDMATLPLTEALYELADRQWHTYSLLDEALKGRLEQLLISRWRDDLEITENLLSIVSRLGLGGGGNFFWGSISSGFQLQPARRSTMPWRRWLTALSIPTTGCARATKRQRPVYTNWGRFAALRGQARSHRDCVDLQVNASSVGAGLPAKGCKAAPILN